jgi:transcriptional regulator with XRE-family HTH domain
MDKKSSFPARLASLRKWRGLSQLQLAAAADCSQRHISFLELGRTQPSREMLRRLSVALGLSFRRSNDLLLAAGFAPIWSDTPFDAETLAPVRQALDFMLEQQEPYPAVVVDRRWNLLQANKGAVAMVEFLVGPLTPGAAVNLADALVAPDVLRRYLTNWQEVVAYFVRSVEADAAADATEETATLRDRLLSYPGVQESLGTPSAETVAAPVLPMRFAKGQVSLELFTTLTILGMPQDATLQEMRIESFFPMNDETRQVFRQWAASAAAIVREHQT